MEKAARGFKNWRKSVNPNQSRSRRKVHQNGASKENLMDAANAKQPWKASPSQRIPQPNKKISTKSKTSGIMDPHIPVLGLGAVSKKYHSDNRETRDVSVLQAISQSKAKSTPFEMDISSIASENSEVEHLSESDAALRNSSANGRHNKNSNDNTNDMIGERFQHLNIGDSNGKHRPAKTDRGLGQKLHRIDYHKDDVHPSKTISSCLKKREQPRLERHKKEPNTSRSEASSRMRQGRIYRMASKGAMVDMTGEVRPIYKDINDTGCRRRESRRSYHKRPDFTPLPQLFPPESPPSTRGRGPNDILNGSTTHPTTPFHPLSKDKQSDSNHKSSKDVVWKMPPSGSQNMLPMRYCHGHKVTMLDSAHMIFAIDLFKGPQACDDIMRIVDSHVAKNEDSRKGWRTLFEYTHMDLPCCEIDALSEVSDWIVQRVKLVIGELFNDPAGASKLRPRSWKEPHFLRYQNVPNKKVHKGIRLHYDGSHFSWQLMLNDRSDYTGGGTYFSCLKNKAVFIKKGQVLVHPGALFHQGMDITSGYRNLLLCFMDGFDPKIKDHV